MYPVSAPLSNGIVPGFNGYVKLAGTGARMLMLIGSTSECATDGYHCHRHYRTGLTQQLPNDF